MAQIVKTFSFTRFLNTQDDARRWLEELGYISIDVRELFSDMFTNGNSYVFGPLELSIRDTGNKSMAGEWIITATFTGVELSTLEIGDWFLPLFAHMAMRLDGFTESGKAICSDGEYMFRQATGLTRESLVWAIDREGE